MTDTMISVEALRLPVTLVGAAPSADRTGTADQTVGRIGTFTEATGIAEIVDTAVKDDRKRVIVELICVIVTSGMQH